MKQKKYRKLLKSLKQTSFLSDFFFHKSFLIQNIYKSLPILSVLVIYLLSIIFTAPTRHGADRYYVLALSIIENRSVNIQHLIDDENHYALASADLQRLDSGTYINMHPGQALLGLPGLSIYRFIRHINNFSHGVKINTKSFDKIDFIFGSYAMNMTSSAMLTALAALFFIYLLNRSFDIRKKKKLKISFFVLLFYLATPLFYYSTHIIQNQSESSLTFIALGLLCIGIIVAEKQKKTIFSGVGFVMGLAFLTNFSSLVLLPFGILHIFLNGFANFDFTSVHTFYISLRDEIISGFRRKFSHTRWLFLGFLLPTLVLLYYQNLIFSNPFTSIHGYLFRMDQIYFPTFWEYVIAFLTRIWQSLFSLDTGLFSFTPILLFPFLGIFLFQHKKQNPREEEVPDLVLKRVLFRTMVFIQPFFILFYAAFEGKTLAEMGWQISLYNLYSARYLLPIIFPLGYILFDTIQKMYQRENLLMRFLQVAFVVLFLFSIIVNITVTIWGDWIFSVSQVKDYFLYLVEYFPSMSRQLVDW